MQPSYHTRTGPPALPSSRHFSTFVPVLGNGIGHPTRHLEFLPFPYLPPQTHPKLRSIFLPKCFWNVLVLCTTLLCRPTSVLLEGSNSLLTGLHASTLSRFHPPHSSQILLFKLQPAGDSPLANLRQVVVSSLTSSCPHIWSSPALGGIVNPCGLQFCIPACRKGKKRKCRPSKFFPKK